MGTEGGPLVVLVGHCGADSGALTRAVRLAAPEARIETAGSDAELDELLGRARLLLINRMLDGAFETDSGLELLRSLDLPGRIGGPRAMLVSNFEAAQQEAEAAGASPGFGKSALRDASTLDRLRAALS